MKWDTCHWGNMHMSTTLNIELANLFKCDRIILLTNMSIHFIVAISDIFLKLILSRERGKERFVIPLIYAFIGWFLYVSWPGIEPTTLAYRDDALTNWVNQPGPRYVWFSSYRNFQFVHAKWWLPKRLLIKTGLVGILDGELMWFLSLFIIDLHTVVVCCVQWEVWGCGGVGSDRRREREREHKHLAWVWRLFYHLEEERDTL